MMSVGPRMCDEQSQTQENEKQKIDRALTKTPHSIRSGHPFGQLDRLTREGGDAGRMCVDSAHAGHDLHRYRKRPSLSPPAGVRVTFLLIFTCPHCSPG